MAKSLAGRFMGCLECLKVTTVRDIDCPKCGSPRRAILLANTDGLTLVDMMRLEESRDARQEAGERHRAQWIFDFVRRVRALNENAVGQLSLDMVALFWTRLHVVLTELRENLTFAYDLISPLSAAQRAAWRSKAPPMYKYTSAQAAAASVIRGIGRGLSDDEHIYADWRRQTESHLTQSSYGLQLQGKRGANRWVKESSKIASLGRSVSIDERDAARARVLSAHANDDTTVAKALASKMAIAAEQLHTVWSSLADEWDVR